mmetsp:Transcript_34425/g.77810  ORF Transcript_34425/g.77810 Transcript_34425/m.77810 type:complete len:263 (-) Transcript_34425:215-1003(-)
MGEPALVPQGEPCITSSLTSPREPLGRSDRHRSLRRHLAHPQLTSTTSNLGIEAAASERYESLEEDPAAEESSEPPRRFLRLLLLFFCFFLPALLALRSCLDSVLPSSSESLAYLDSPRPPLPSRSSLLSPPLPPSLPPSSPQVRRSVLAAGVAWWRGRLTSMVSSISTKRSRSRSGSVGKSRSSCSSHGSQLKRTRASLAPSSGSSGKVHTVDPPASPAAAEVLNKFPTTVLGPDTDLPPIVKATASPPRKARPFSWRSPA